MAEEALDPKVIALKLNLYDIFYPGGKDRGLLPMRVLRIARYSDMGRFRDAWIERSPLGQLHVHIYTRNGGKNRADQADAIAWMRSHPWFERDEDDSYDRTYASFWFLVPPGRLAGLETFVVDAVDTGKRWAEDMRKLEDGTIDPAVMQRGMDRLGPLLEQAMKVSDSGPEGPRTAPS